MKEPSVKCPTCGGSGRTTLSDTMLKTFRVVKQLRKASAPDVLGKMPDEVSVSAINNRLEDLRKLGLIKRKRVGKLYEYSPA